MIVDLCFEDEVLHNICGEVYTEFIEKCFKYSAYFSVLTPPKQWYSKDILLKSIPTFLKLHPYLVNKKRINHYPGTVNDGFDEEVGTFELNIYKCCEETKRIVLETCDELFSWTDGNPENLTFYYADKNIFINTIAHEGICTISCSKEIFEEFKKYGMWYIVDQESLLQEKFF